MCTNPITITVNGEEYKVKCGKCDTCQKQKYQEWAIKLINETKYHKKACFITLTFDNKILLSKDKKINKYGANASYLFNINYSKDYFCKFIKRLRKKTKKYISYFHVGEYGEKTKRCHHHAIIYGYNFENDRIEMQKSKSGKQQFFSKELTKLWGAGLCTVQDLNTYNTTYICQYSLKKYKFNDDNKKYKPIMSFSNRTKISTKWIRRNYEELVRGYIEDTEGKKYRIPKSYIKEIKNSEIKQHRKAYEEYENNLINSKYYNKSDNERIKQEKIKERVDKSLKKHKQNSIRDF